MTTHVRSFRCGMYRM